MSEPQKPDEPTRAIPLRLLGAGVALAVGIAAIVLVVLLVRAVLAT